MLEVSGLTKDYRGGKDWIRAVDGVGFSVTSGEIVAVLGPNGAGKTTMLRCIAGILRAQHGTIRINGFDLINDEANAKSGLAYVPEVPALYELLTVDEHLRFVAMCFRTLSEYDKRGRELLERFRLWEKKDELVASLSKGMRQKLSVACAMVHNANVFLFDEPLIGIDPAGVVEVKNQFREIKAAGGAVLVSTHLLDTAERLADRLLIMARGKLLFDGTLAQLRERSQLEGATLEDMFLKLTGERLERAAPLEPTDEGGLADAGPMVPHE